MSVLARVTKSLLLATCAVFPVSAWAQAFIPASSPFSDPDTIYLEADELINDEAAQILTVQGSVEGKYQGRTLRADKVIYNLETGAVFAVGNVVLIDATGSTQYADKLELSDKLEAGTATQFVARTPDGGLTAAALATRADDGGIDLFNAYYTACEVCAEDPTPSWRIRARRVSQDRDRSAIFYRDAVFELAGIPIFYTPYLSHPDPSADRASGLLTPTFAITGDKGFVARVPYFWAVDDYTDLVLTPRIHSRVNPGLEIDVVRQFATGRFNLNSSLFYGSIFDQDGDPLPGPEGFADPDNAPTGRRLRSHTFADGRFNPNENWTYGFGIELASDDTYLERLDYQQRPNTRGLYEADSRRLISQAYLVGQDDDFRLTASSYGFQSLRTTISEATTGIFVVSGEDDGTLPIIAPQLTASKYFDLGGSRLEAFGDLTYLTRQTGVDYGRGSAGLSWSDTWIAPGGVEVKPFALGRFDTYEIEAPGEETDAFERTLGLAGVDIRYPFIKRGETIDWIVEPRVQVTQSVGDGKLERFSATGEADDFDFFQDSLAIDLDPTLLWEPNKATGFDFWQSGFRADAGASVAARWGAGNEASLFVGQSYASGTDANFILGSGLSGDTSNVVAQAEVNLGSNFRTRTRLRFDDEKGEIRTLDSSAFLRISDLSMSARYFRVQDESVVQTADPLAPQEELSGGLRWQVLDDWAFGYAGSYDVDKNAFRRQNFSVIFNDDCTRIEVIYTRDNIDRGQVGDADGFTFRITLATLGGID